MVISAAAGVGVGGIGVAVGVGLPQAVTNSKINAGTTLRKRIDLWLIVSSHESQI
jgi:hypothetical protein